MKKIITGALTLLLFAGAAQAQTKDTGKHHKEGREHFAKQLNLTAEQQEKINTLRKSQHEEMTALRENKSITAEQQKARREELRKKFADQSAAIYTPAQKEQMAKMKAEWKAKGKEARKDGKKGEGRKHGKGAKGGRGDDFAKNLNLTETQKSELGKLRAESKGQHDALRNDKSLTDEQKKEKIKLLKQQQKEKMRSILTKEQIEKLEAGRKDRKARQTK